MHRYNVLPCPDTVHPLIYKTDNDSVALTWDGAIQLSRSFSALYFSLILATSAGVQPFYQ